jgi:hypothetical protein
VVDPAKHQEASDAHIEIAHGAKGLEIRQSAVEVDDKGAFAAAAYRALISQRRPPGIPHLERPLGLLLAAWIICRDFLAPNHLQFSRQSHLYALTVIVLGLVALSVAASLVRFTLPIAPSARVIGPRSSRTTN